MSYIIKFIESHCRCNKSGNKAQTVIYHVNNRHTDLTDDFAITFICTDILFLSIGIITLLAKRNKV